MIYNIWYPPGGFGNFITVILNMYGKNFVRPKDMTISISGNGNSHFSDKPTPPRYLNKTWDFQAIKSKNYAVLVLGTNDIPINKHIEKQVVAFQDTTIKITIDKTSWPIVAQTMAIKALQSDLRSNSNADDWNSNDDWALREAYFLNLKDHPLISLWSAHNDMKELKVNHIIDYNKLVNQIKLLGIDLVDFKVHYDIWYNANYKYFKPVFNALKIINNIKNDIDTDLSYISDVWDQAVLYYFIWIEFKFEIPHNNYPNFFTNSNQIVDLLRVR